MFKYPLPIEAAEVYTGIASPPPGGFELVAMIEFGELLGPHYKHRFVTAAGPPPATEQLSGAEQMGTFDPATFLDVEVSDANSTVSTPCPAGDYVAVAGEPKVRPWKAKDGTSEGLALDIPWTIDDQAAKEAVGRDKVIVFQGIMLDLNDSGGLDTGKGANVALGKLREAIGMNVPGQPFSFRRIEGQVAKVKVSHKPDGEVIRANVTGVAKV